MKIFITGGIGFIGSHLVPKLLARKHKLFLLVERRMVGQRAMPRGVAVVRGDLKDIRVWGQKVKKFKPDAVIHLAWQGLGSYDYSPATSKKNLENSIRLIRFGGEVGCKKFLSAGSCWEYAATKGKLKESAKLLTPTHVPEFVFAKRTIQKLGEKIAKQYGMQFFWPRLFFVYGPGQRSVSLIPTLVSSFKKGDVPEIKNKMGGNDFVYIKDVVDAIIAILEKCKKQSAVYNVGSGQLTSVARVVNLVAKELGEKSIIKEPKRVKGFYSDISKIRREIGWQPKTSVEEGVKKTIEYHSEYHRELHRILPRGSIKK